MIITIVYKHFRSAWESVPSDKQTLEERTSPSLLEEERYKSQEPSTIKTTCRGQENLGYMTSASTQELASTCPGIKNVLKG
ncbi:hypothetical protein HHI36_012674 [Cryptolaemus montrouzieri]|uniref:Uncharacterized protein n=1 Tax=Cryptolaemus montrouzieri TaxID=559131 RepID=A0ABD2NEY2_9CUCU